MEENIALLLNIAKELLQSIPPLSFSQRETLFRNNFFTRLPTEVTNRDDVRTFISLLLGTHPLFSTKRFLSPFQYNPLQYSEYQASHRIPWQEKSSDTHGNNYLYTQANLRNGIITTYHDIETNIYLPFTFNTNAPLCLVVPDPIKASDPVPILQRMLKTYNEVAQQESSHCLPLVIKGVMEETADKISLLPHCTKITIDPDVTTIPAEMNMPAISYNIARLMEIVRTTNYLGQRKKPKVINTVKRLDQLITCEDWHFNEREASSLVQQWANSKLTRLKNQGHAVNNDTYNYLVTSILQTIAKPPLGKLNEDFFAIAVRSKDKTEERKSGQLLGVIIASRNTQTVAALNAVVVPVQKGLRDLGYYSVYKLVESISRFGIRSYWHGPKESASDVQAVIEFFGEPDKKDKKYCIRWERK